MSGDGERAQAKGDESPVVFECAGEDLVGVASLPAGAAPLGVLLVVGGPQVRTGSHRMFTLLARALAARGFASLRFDYRGMGDSSGEMRNFEHVQADIAAAAAVLRERAPGVERLVLWGLCDAASAALLALPRLQGVAGVVLVNPWVRSAQSLDRALVRHYYGSRLLSRDFWRKLFSGGLDPRRVAGEFLARVGAARRAGAGEPADDPADGPADFRARMLQGWQGFSGRILVVLSGQDLTAREFEDHAGADPRWSLAPAHGRVRVCRIEAADHTFSDPVQHAGLVRATLEFLERL
jgi:exosortase A-associated hydrolase 1